MQILTIKSELPHPSFRLLAPSSKLPAPSSRLPAPGSLVPRPGSLLPVPTCCLPAPSAKPHLLDPASKLVLLHLNNYYLLHGFSLLPLAHLPASSPTPRLHSSLLAYIATSSALYQLVPSLPPALLISCLSEPSFLSLGSLVPWLPIGSNFIGTNIRDTERTPQAKSLKTYFNKPQRFPGLQPLHHKYLLHATKRNAGKIFLEK